jgi:formylglycine-generating enzyme required for sulfatase activity
MRVTIQPFAVGRFEVTRAQYAAFVRETGRAVGGNCWTVNSAGIPEQQQGATWQSPGFDQTGDHPVVCVSWEDAQAYVAWINGKVSGDPYRLLSESEWEYAARAGTTTRLWWGDGEADLCTYANGADQAARSRFSSWTWTVSCNDGHVFTAPAGFSGRENRFGLADMAGNVWEWTQDCYNSTYDLTPTNGAANTTGDCSLRVLRGGSWGSLPNWLRSADRRWGSSTNRINYIGFRLARDLEG